MAVTLFALFTFLSLLWGLARSSTYLGSPSFVRKFAHDNDGYYPFVLGLPDDDIIFAY